MINLIDLAQKSMQNVLYPYVLIGIPIALFIIIILVRMNFVKFKDSHEKKEFNKEKRLDRIFMIISRTLIVGLLLIAIASPFIYEQIKEPGDPSLKILIDRSGSFGIFGNDIDKQLKDKIGDKIPVTIVDIEPGNRSALGNAIRNNMQGNDNILLVTDAYSTEGWYLSDAILFANQQNTVVNALDVAPKYSDQAVVITGPSQILQDAEEEFFITINQVGDVTSNLRIVVDGTEIINKKVDKQTTISFKKSFKEGDHKIIASIDANDYFPENNVFYKTVHVVEKPKVLLLTKESSPLKTVLGEIYNLDVQNSLPNDISNYHAIVIDNINEGELNGKVDQLKDYLEKGNGILYVGGKNTFEFNDQCNPAKTPDLSNCLVDSLLPVNVGYGGNEEFKDVNVVFVIDISGSTGEQFSNKKEDEKVAVEKALAIEMLKGMKQDYKVGVVAFNHMYYLISDLKPLYDSPNLNMTIARLEFKGGTVMVQGLRKAQDILKDASGSKNVIVISDGLTQFPDDALNKASEMAGDGINIYALGVGSDTDATFMQALAQRGNGVFYQPNELQKVKIALEKGDDTKLDKFTIQTLDTQSFITSNIELDAFVTGFNQVVPKGSGKVLVSTEKKSPIITTWRFGLGRVAVLSTDNGNKWASQMYSAKNSKLITRTANWLIGDPDRVKSYSVKVKDTYVGEPTDIAVMSDKVPSLAGYDFSKIELGEKDLYTATFNPTSAGIFKFDTTIAAVNYPVEYQRIGLNPELKNLVEGSGGGFFKIEDADKLVEKVKKDSVRVRNDMKFFRWPFVIAALAILMIEIAFRRFRENYLMARK